MEKTFEIKKGDMLVRQNSGYIYSLNGCGAQFILLLTIEFSTSYDVIKGR